MLAIVLGMVIMTGSLLGIIEFGSSVLVVSFVLGALLIPVGIDLYQMKDSSDEQTHDDYTIEKNGIFMNVK